MRASYVSEGEDATAAIAQELAEGFRGGETVLLHGELGAGKTAFVRGLAKGLGADPEAVCSPTFVMLTSYRGRLSLHHADLYRLERVGIESELGLEELPGAGGVLAIEWAERLAENLWTKPFQVRLAHAGENRRRIEIERAD